MIPVQIASELTSVGVSGLRWVLIDASASAPAEAAPVQPEQPALPLALAAALPGRPQLGLWAWAITGLGLVAALLVSHWQLGPSPLSGAWPGASPARVQGPAQPEAPLRPAAAPPAATPEAGRQAPGMPSADEQRQPAPLPVDPAGSSPRHERLITAGLS